MIKLLWLKRNKLTAVSILSFMLLCSFLFSLTFFLFFNLFGSVDQLMEKGRTPDLVQLHAGAIDEKQLDDFVLQHKQVLDYQTVLFLTIDNSQIVLNGKNLADSSQDHGLVVQSPRFDYLLDLDDRLIEPQQGQIYLPVSYQKLYHLEVGQAVNIVQQEFVIAGFLRDSQMTSMLASSKRFLISEADREALLDKGESEYLIEFILDDSTTIDSFVSVYHQANLPANGPTITKSLIRLASGLSDGVMVVVILFTSLALLLIAILCSRFLILMTLEKDKKEIGLLKAIGYSSSAIRKMSVEPYVILSLIGAVIGVLIAFYVQGMISEQIKILYGLSDNSWLHLLSGIAGAVLAEGIILLSIAKTMGKVKQMSALSILLGKDERTRQIVTQRTRQRFGAVIVGVIGLCLMLVILPLNLWQTLSSPSFVSYMGIGNSDIRIDLRQSDTITDDTKRLLDSLQTDPTVESVVALTTYSVQAQLPTTEETRLLVESGNHQQFPVSYIEGEAPNDEQDIAVSYLYANDNHLKLGDSLLISLEDGVLNYNISGIYSDITNGGKTAKVSNLLTRAKPTWSVLYLTAKPHERGKLLENLNLQSQQLNIDAKIIAISDYVQAIYGSTLDLIKTANRVVTSVAILVLSVVIYLFMRLVLMLDREDIAMLKAIGLASTNLKKNYLLSYLSWATLGIIFGTIFALSAGEVLVSAVLRQFGLVGFHFIVNWTGVVGVIPALFFMTILMVMSLAMKTIDNIKAYRCFKERG